MSLVRFVALIGFAVCLSNCATLFSSPLKQDEELVYYSTAGFRDKENWNLPVHAHVFSRKEDSLIRGAIISTIAKVTGVEENSLSSDLLKKRIRWFLIDNKSYKKVEATLLGLKKELEVSGSNGHIKDNITVPQNSVNVGASSTSVQIETKLPFGGVAQGNLFVIPPTGLSIISDIDDTIKISEVSDKKALMKNTFLEPFRAVPGMGALYTRLSSSHNAQFHYVSASPWQLYSELYGFFKSEGFPEGVYHMKYFRWSDTDFFNLFQNPFEYKMQTIVPILEQYPGRKFVLIGDSSEKDPEAYGELARRFPGQVQRIVIRNVSTENQEERYRKAFADLPVSLWQIFTLPAEIKIE